jgi:hypothetical protein
MKSHLFLLLSLSLFANVAKSESIKITSGYLSARGESGAAKFALEGDGFSIYGHGRGLGNVAARSCFPCTEGSELSVNSRFAGEDALGSGAGTVNGREYKKLFFSGVVEFESLNAPQLEKESLLIETPFHFHGYLNGFEKNLFAGNPGPAIFSYSVSGEGIASIYLRSTLQNGNRLYFFDEVLYSFNVPEPSTLLLISSGLAAALFARKRRRESSD